MSDWAEDLLKSSDKSVEKAIGKFYVLAAYLVEGTCDVVHSLEVPFKLGC